MRDHRHSVRQGRSVRAKPRRTGGEVRLRRTSSRRSTKAQRTVTKGGKAKFVTNGRGDRQQGPQMPDKAVDYSHSDLRSQPGDLRTTCNDSTGYRPTWRSSVKTHAQSGERSE